MVALSSEAPVERTDWETGERYLEVLDHDPANVDLSYARDGLPLLMDHTDRELVGLLGNVRVDKDRRLRGEPKWSQSTRAREVFQDVVDGIRNKMSLGYKVLRELSRETDEATGLELRRYAFRPLEGSLVAVPADYTVGVNRQLAGAPLHLSTPGDVGAPPVETSDSNSQGPDRAEDTTMTDETKPSGQRVEGGESREAQVLRERTEALANIAKANNMTDRLPEWLSGERSISAIQEEILAEYRSRAATIAAPGHVDLTPKEQRRFSIARALEASYSGNWRGAEFELEVSNTIRDRLDRETRGLFVPLTLHRASVTGDVVGTASLGGNVVQTSLLSLIELLRNKMKVRMLGATVLTGLRDNIAFPRQITANTLSWTGENPSTGNANTAATFDQVTMSPKTAMGSTAYSRQLLRQGTIDVDNFIGNDLASISAIGLDSAAINGPGTAAPVGILNASSGVTVKALGTNGAVPTFADWVDLETQQATNNADDGALRILTTPGIRGLMKVTEKATNTAQFVWTGGPMDGEVNGYPAFVSNQVPATLTKGTATTICHGIIFGNWPELLIGEWGGAMELLTDPFTVASQNMIQVHSFLMADIAVRHGASFTVIKDARLS